MGDDIDQNIFDCTKEQLKEISVVESNLNKFKDRLAKIEDTVILEKKLKGATPEQIETFKKINFTRIQNIRSLVYYFINIILNGPQLVSVYEGNTPIFFNDKFCETKGITKEEIKDRLNGGEDMLRITYEGLTSSILKARKYISMFQSGKIDGYRNALFEMPCKGEDGNIVIKKILWNTARLPNGLNIRIGFEPKDMIHLYDEEFLKFGDISSNNNENISIGEKEVGIRNINLIEILFFSERLHKTFESLNVEEYDSQDFFKNIRLMSLMLDFYFNFGSVPASVYFGKEPRLINKALENLLGYSEKEVKKYYLENRNNPQAYGVAGLYYKGEHLEKVIKKLTGIENSGVGSGYTDDFTATSKPDENGKTKDITIDWTTLNCLDGYTIRSGIPTKVEWDVHNP